MGMVVVVEFTAEQSRAEQYSTLHYTELNRPELNRTDCAGLHYAAYSQQHCTVVALLTRGGVNLVYLKSIEVCVCVCV